MVPELWLTEGGQSATGALLDHIVETHPAAPALANRAAHQSEFYFFLCTSSNIYLVLSVSPLKVIICRPSRRRVDIVVGNRPASLVCHHLSRLLCVQSSCETRLIVHGRNVLVQNCQSTMH